MPARSLADRETILRVYDETKSARETARRLGLHDNTVYGVLRVERGRCRRCANEVRTGREYCPDCLRKLADGVKTKRAERRRRGVCSQCDDPIERPSTLYCARHRDEHRQATAKYDAGRKATGGVPAAEHREIDIRRLYGPAAVEVWRRHGGRCELCGVGHADRAVHIHHLDKNHRNREEQNLSCLCHPCHRLVHFLTEHADPAGALAWIRAKYPVVVI